MKINQIKESEKNVFLLQVYVKPNSRREKIESDGDYIAISVKSKARRNKANKDLLKLLKKRLDLPSRRIQIMSGLTNTDKIIQIDYSLKNEDVSKKKILDLLFSS